MKNKHETFKKNDDIGYVSHVYDLKLRLYCTASENSNNSVAVKRNNCAKLSKSVKLGMDVAEYILNGS